MKLPFAPFVVLVSAAVARADYPEVVLADEPLAYFRFEEEAGAAFAVDSSGNGNDATDYSVIGTGEIGVQAAIGRGVRFNGDGAIITGLTLDPAAGDFSIELILRRESTSNATEVVVANQDGGGLGRSNLTTIPVADTGTAALGSFVGGATTNSGIAVEAGDWQHLVLTYDAANSTIHTFVNGVEGASGFVAAESAAGAWVIGSHKSTNSQWTNGTVDEVAIYDKRLDDPNGDGDIADSVVGAHFATYLDDVGLFKFGAEDLSIAAGESTTLTWEVSPTMTALDIDNGVGDVLPETEGNPGERYLGSILVSPAVTTTYTLTGTNPFETDVLSVEVIVDPPPVIDLFIVSRDRIDSGEMVDLTWAITDATSAEIDNGVGAVDPSAGTVSVLITDDTTYTLTATSAGGSVTAEVSVDADPLPLIDSFTASQSEVAVGGTVALSWEATDALSVEIDNGVGGVSPVSGTVNVVVNADTTFTLTATNGNGMTTAEVSVQTFAVGDPNLVAHWRVGEQAGETDGTILLPEFGGFLDGTFVGTPAFDTADPAPVPTGSTASIVFDGLNSWVDILGWNGIGGVQARTVAFWFKGPAQQQNQHGTLISWGANTTTNRFDTRVSANARNGTMRTEVSGSGRDSSLFMADDTWHHAAVVIVDDGSPNIGEALFYVDGVLDEAAVGGNTDINSSTTLNVRIGASRAIGNRSLTGKMDDIRIYDRALAAEEILQLIEGPGDAFRITSIVRNGDGSVTLEWNGAPGKFYSVDYSADFREGNWLELADGLDSNEITDTTNAPDADTLFYRVREEE